MTADRIPPHNLEAEMALIGSALVDREIMPEILEQVRAEDFYAHVHESLFAALQALYERGEPLDKITVAEHLRSKGILEKVGGLAYLSSLMDTVQTAASAKYYATIVREKAVLRTLIHSGTQIAQLGFEGEEDVAAAVDLSEQLVLSINERNDTGAAVPLFTLLAEGFNRLGDKEKRGLTTGFSHFDAITTGLHGSNFAIIAGRPGMGKTTIGMGMALAAARQALAEQLGDVLFYSLEMSQEELTERIISTASDVDLHTLRAREVRPRQWEQISGALAAIHDLPLLIDDSGGLSVSQLRSRARRHKARRGLAAIFIDYLQLLHPSVRARGERTPQNRNEEISDICRTLKAMSKELAIPIVALAQVNRAVETRADKRPMLADLRDSGSIEQEADLVAFVYRDAYYNPSAAEDEAELIIAKQRNGRIGTLPLRFVASTVSYVEHGAGAFA